jgi:hypothetical protein
VGGPSGFHGVDRAIQGSGRHFEGRTAGYTGGGSSGYGYDRGGWARRWGRYGAQVYGSSGYSDGSDSYGYSDSSNGYGDGCYYAYSQYAGRRVLVCSRDWSRQHDFDIERGINGLAADERLRIRKERSAPLLTALEAWLRSQRSRLSRSTSLAEPIDYMLKRWNRFARFIGDGRICLSNNAAERALRGFVLGRKSWLFAGSDRGADRAADMVTLILTAKLIDPQAWLADVLTRVASLSQGRLRELLPWIAAPMSGLPRNLKQLDEELLALGEETMLLEKLDGFIAGWPVRPTWSSLASGFQSSGIGIAD